MVKAIRITVEALLLIATAIAIYWGSKIYTLKETAANEPAKTWHTIAPVGGDTLTRYVYYPVIKTLPPDTFYLPIDTAQVLREYFSHTLYVQKYSDSLLDIEVKDSIGENKLLSQTVRYKTKTFPSAQKENRFWCGLEIDTKGETGLTLYLSDTRQNIYGLGVTSDKTVRFTCLFPLQKRRGR